MHLPTIDTTEYEKKKKKKKVYFAKYNITILEWFNCLLPLQ